MNSTLRSVRRPLVVWVSAMLLTCAGHELRAAAADDRLREELRQLKTVYENAISSGNLAPLEPLFTPDSSGVVVDNQRFKTFAELKGIYDRFRAQFPGVVYKITLQPEQSQIFGDLAVARGTCDEFVKTEAGEFTYTSSFTVVLRRTEAGWKLVRSHLTMDPFRNSIVEHFLGKAKLYFGAGALVAGLVLGFVLGRAGASRKNPAATPA